MKNIQYRASLQVGWNMSIGTYSTGAITAYRGQTEVGEIRDISMDMDFVEALAEQLNRNEVSLLHFHDVVEDCMALQ